jgi:hypothetical protein
MHAIDMTLDIETSKSSTTGHGGRRRCGIVLIEYFTPTCIKTVQLAQELHAIFAAYGRELSTAQYARTPAPKVQGR